MEKGSIAALIEAAAKRFQSDSAVFDAEVLLAHVLQVERSYLRTHPEKVISKSQQADFEQLVSARANGQPIAYLTEHQPFWRLDLKVSPDVLIPRADTETLVEAALQLIPEHEPFKVLDLGTGSGAIVLSLAQERPQASFVAAERQAKALSIARENATRNQINNVEFIESDWYSSLEAHRGTFDLIVSNPPYLAADDPHLHEGDLRFEPVSALVADKEGLADIQDILSEGRGFLKAQGVLMVEHGMTQAKAIQQLFADYGYHSIETLQDLGSRDRVTLAKKTNLEA